MVARIHRLHEDHTVSQLNYSVSSIVLQDHNVLGNLSFQTEIYTACLLLLDFAFLLGGSFSIFGPLGVQVILFVVTIFWNERSKTWMKLGTREVIKIKVFKPCTFNNERPLAILRQPWTFQKSQRKRRFMVLTLSKFDEDRSPKLEKWNSGPETWSSNYLFSTPRNLPKPSQHANAKL